ncbi:MAG: T9SS type A sorting domain-containing protein [Saprospiraceae bacterium]
MKKLLPLILGLLTCSWALQAQVVIDFEAPSSSLNFQYFGGSAEGVQSTTIANPNASGINTSANVLEFTKVGDAPVWGGAFANPAPSLPIDATNGGQICIKVHFDHIGNVAIKLEQASSGENWITSVANSKMGEWEELCFDLGAPSLEDSNQPATGRVFGQLVLFVDFGIAGTGSAVTTYIDDITYMTTPEDANCQLLYDFDTEATSTNFQIFGSALDGQLTTIVNNPNASGSNTSASVVQYIKAGDAQVWGGAFANPAPSSPIDATNGGEICVKVHMDHIGNVAIKLEQSTTGGDNWITTVANTKVNEWEELCFDFSVPSLEDSKQPATGRAFAVLVIFFDFGTAGTGSDVTSYFDDIAVCTPVTNEIVDVTFAVDMNSYEGSFTQVYVSGDFNGWSGESNPMSDEDEDGVWTVTLPLGLGPIEYKFTLDNWSAQEIFNGSESCTKLTVTEDGGRFANRTLVVAGADSSPAAVCFNSCYACGESVKITFNLGMTAVQPAESGVFLAGGLEFGAPNERFRMTDGDGDGVYSLTIERAIGFNGFYTFTNGACANFSCKENIAGQDCARSDNFNDRFLNAVSADTIVATCFGECSIDNNCMGAPEGGDVSFSVDMSGFSGSFTTVYVSGTFNNWSGDGNPLSDEDGDGIWQGTYNLSGGNYEFKFTTDNWTNQEGFEPGGSCTVTDPSGQFINRSLVVDGNVSLCFPWNSCVSCLVGTTELSTNPNLVKINPNLVTDFTRLTFEPNVGVKALELWDFSGRLVWQNKIDAGQDQFELSMTPYQSGIYLLRVRTEDMVITKRIIKQ